MDEILHRSKTLEIRNGLIPQQKIPKGRKTIPLQQKSPRSWAHFPWQQLPTKLINGHQPAVSDLVSRMSTSFPVASPLLELPEGRHACAIRRPAMGWRCDPPLAPKTGSLTLTQGVHQATSCCFFFVLRGGGFGPSKNGLIPREFQKWRPPY